MIVNGKSLLERAPLSPMIGSKSNEHGTSFGLSEAGYDIRVQQKIEWHPPDPIDAMVMLRNTLLGTPIDQNRFLRALHGFTCVTDQDGRSKVMIGRTALASSIERFDVPRDLYVEFRNKSTHARRFVDATICTDGEPGWRGHLTIEIVFHGLEPVVIPAGAGILKAVFHQLAEPADYGEDGKYQDQPAQPVPAILG